MHPRWPDLNSQRMTELSSENTGHVKRRLGEWVWKSKHNVGRACLYRLEIPCGVAMPPLGVLLMLLYAAPVAELLYD